jgi:hypothetical protein
MSVPGFSIKKVFVVVCELCNENVIERADEDTVQTVDAAEWEARLHREQHYADGSLKRRGRRWRHDA